MMMRGNASGARTLVALLSLLVPTAGVAVAQSPTQPPRAPDPVRGREIAEKLCVACHRIAPEQPATPVADVPSFPEIANRPDRTPERIMGAIMMPHPPMPDIALATPALKDLAAYILTYRRPR
jgi:mono/diheme cytochrome c family protein